MNLLRVIPSRTIYQAVLKAIYSKSSITKQRLSNYFHELSVLLHFYI